MANAPTASTASKSLASLPVETNSLARVVVRDEVQVSKLTRDCLEYLRSPVANTCFSKGDYDDLSKFLSPLTGYVLTLLSARNAIQNNLTHIQAINHENLRLSMQK